MRLFLVWLLAFCCNAWAGSYTTCVGGECERVQVNSITDGGPGFNTSLGAYETSNGGTATRVNTIASQQVLVGAGLLKRIIVATTTAGTVAVYDDSDGTCSSTQKTGTITPAAGAVLELGIEVSAGICILTGGTAIDMTVVFLP